MEMVKKGIIILVIIALVIGFLFLIINENEEGLRLRIVCDENTEVGLYEKRIVKDALEEVLNENDIDINNVDTLLIYSELIKKTKGLIQNEIKVEVINSYYPAKSYNDMFVPSGNYITLLITIGKGDGSNFWTLLYPEYFNIEFEEANEIEYRFYILDLINKIFN